MYPELIGLAKVAAGPGHLELTERDERRPGAGEAEIMVHAAGVCGTDLHIEAGEYPCSIPVTLGHEVAGVVVAVGPDVDPGLVGARVVAETFFSVCKECQYCREGRPNLCTDRRSIGTHVDGAFAPRLIVPSANLHQVPEWLSDRAAALAEPLACVCQCLLDPSAVTSGALVLVVGPGPIGLIAAQVSRALGGEVTIVGLPSDERRLAVARELGLHTERATPGALSADVVIECSGSESGAATAIAAVTGGGQYIQLGIFGRAVTLPFDQLLFKEVSFRTGFASTPRSWRRAMALIRSRMVELEPLVSSVVPLHSWREAFARLRTGDETKIVLDPRIPEHRSSPLALSKP